MTVLQPSARPLDETLDPADDLRTGIGFAHEFMDTGVTGLTNTGRGRLGREHDHRSLPTAQCRAPQGPHEGNPVEPGRQFREDQGGLYRTDGLHSQITVRLDHDFPGPELFDDVAQQSGSMQMGIQDDDATDERVQIR